MGFDVGSFDSAAAATQGSRRGGMMIRGADARYILTAIFFVLLFCSISVGMVIAGRGIPAVFDGNETFSSILHARNLLTFGPEKSVGLADESTSPWSQGHPAVHTHQGNFPRLYATILYALGLTSPSSQVLATVLPVGMVSVLLLFAALHRFAGIGVAAATTAFLLTDYIMFVQWQMVTYRIWHFAFTAILLAATVTYQARRHRWLLGVAFVASMFLFYYELVFATFLSVSISLFTLVICRRDITRGITFVGAQVAGAGTGVSVLIAQLVAYLGWDGFVTDLKLTYLSRNVGEPQQLSALRTFVEQHNIAFFYNFADPSTHNLKALILDSFFRWGLQAYTPPFAYCILVLATGVGVALFAKRGRVRWPQATVIAVAAMMLIAWFFGSNTAVSLVIITVALALPFAMPDGRAWVQNVTVFDAAMLLGAPALMFVLMAASFSYFLGFAREAGSLWQVAAVFTAASTLTLALVFLRAVPREPGKVPLDIVLRGAALLCAAIAFTRFHARLYDVLLIRLWQAEIPGPFMPASLQAAGMVLATICAAILAAFGPGLPDAVRAPLRHATFRVATLISCFVAGFLFVIILSPGYMYSGYFVRYVGLLALPLALFAGWVAYAIAFIVKGIIAEICQERRGGLAVASRLHLAPLAVFAIWWVAIQAADARAYPPNQLAVLNALQALAPERPTIVSNTYPGPFSVITGQWAYLDEIFSAGHISFSTASGYRYVFGKRYLWVADRNNPKYERPDVFVCFVPPTFWSEAIRLADLYSGTRCSENRIVQFAVETEKRAWPRPTVIARDPSVRDAWALVRLDWDFPPYVAERPVVTGTPDGNVVSLNVTYDYRQQDRIPERLTEVELWEIARNGATCTLRGAPLATTEAVGGQVALSLARVNPDNEVITLVRPHTATRSGASFFSAPFRVGQGAIKAVDQPCNAIVDVNRRVWPQTRGG